MFCKQKTRMMNESLFPDMTFSPKTPLFKVWWCPSIWLLKVRFSLVFCYFLPLSTWVMSLIYTGYASPAAPKSTSRPARWLPSLAGDGRVWGWGQWCAIFPSMAFPRRKARFAGMQRDVEYCSRSCDLPQRTHLQHIADMVHIA